LPSVIYFWRMQKNSIVLWLFFLALLFGCAQNPAASPVAPTQLELNPPYGKFTPSATNTIVPTATASPSTTASATPTETATATETSTPTIIPTYTVLRGKVLVEKLSCRFGPGAMYLFKYTVFQETVLEIIGRMELSSWILVQAVGGRNACWVNGDYLEIRGDINTVAPTDPHAVLAWSPYYQALTGVSAERNGDVVTVFWNQLVLRDGDSSEQVPYVVEAWVCREGQIVFAPVGAYSLAAEVVDEPGCDQPSHVRVLGAEKHGYTQWRVVPWPQVNPGATPIP
jgi:hypothetical protein